jgi:transketolase
MSKGHAASALYAILAKRRFFKEDILRNYCADGCLPGHATRDCVPGLEVSTGSLGHGLPIGTGMALAAKHDKANNRIFVLLSDGECDEGSVWEAAMFAGHHGLDNLVAIIDYNNIQAFGRTKEVLDLEPFAEKWRSFKWAAKEVNGHDLDDLMRTSLAIPFSMGKPSVIIAHTVKGKGVSFMEDTLTWHYKSPDKDQLSLALKELEESE